MKKNANSNEMQNEKKRRKRGQDEMFMSVGGGFS